MSMVIPYDKVIFCVINRSGSLNTEIIKKTENNTMRSRTQGYLGQDLSSASFYFEIEFTLSFDSMLDNNERITIIDGHKFNYFSPLISNWTSSHPKI